MSITERVRAFLANIPPDEDGQPQEIALLPPVSIAALAALGTGSPLPFSSEISELFAYCGGFNGGALEHFSFTGERARYVYSQSLKGRFQEFASDGYGNFWFYWLPVTSADLGPIYYYEHEGPMLLYQSPGLVNFIDEWMKFMTPPYRSLIDDVHEFRIKSGALLNRDLIGRAAVMAGDDALLKDFIRVLPDDAQVYDFREASVGDGVDFKGMELLAVHDRLPILAVRARNRWERAKAFFLGSR